jgi:hypothetical protein
MQGHFLTTQRRLLLENGLPTESHYSPTLIDNKLKRRRTEEEDGFLNLMYPSSPKIS